MKKNFELIDSILTENGAASIITKPSVSIKDDFIYEDLDELILTAMKETLCEACVAYGTDPQVVLEQTSIIRETNFTEEQITSFWNNSIKPIVEVTYNENAKVSVPLIVYEIAETISEFEAENQDYFTECFGKVTIQEQVTDLPLVLEDAITKIFDSYDITESEDQLEILEHVDAVLEENDFSEITIVTEDVAEFVSEYNLIAEEYGFENFAAILEADGVANSEKLAKANKTGVFRKAFNKAKGAGSKAWNKTKGAGKYVGGKAKTAAGKTLSGTKTAGKYVGGKAKAAGSKVVSGTKTSGKWVGGKAKTAAAGTYNAAWKNRSTKGKVGVAAATAAAIAAAAALAWAKKSAACRGLEGDAKASCLKKAAQVGLATAKRSMKDCDDARNPERCKKSVTKEISKWQAKVEKYSR